MSAHRSVPFVLRLVVAVVAASLVPGGMTHPLASSALASTAATSSTSQVGALAPPGLNLPRGVSWVRQLEGVWEYRLDNGLQVLLYPDESKPTTTVNVTYKVGSRMENYGETGMAHLLEHLMFKGSTHYPKPDRDFSARGFRNNGSTYYDRTNYYSSFKASDDNLRWALSREADAMVHSFIARKDLDTEMTVVRNEYEMGENRPEAVLQKRLLSAMFNWHSYGKEPIGNRSDIENVAIANLQAFYRQYYQPDNAVLVVTGQFDPHRTLGWIVQSFGSIPKPKRAFPPQWTTEPTQDGERQITVRRQGSSQLVMVGYHVPAEASRDGAAVGLAAQILGEGASSRLHKALVETGLASDVFVEDLSLRDSGVVIFGAQVKLGDSLEAVRDRLVDEVEHGLGKLGIGADELTRLKQESDTGIERVLDDPQEFGVALSESIAQGDWRYFFVDRDQVAATRAEQVNAAAARYFRRDNRTLGLFVPEDHPQRAEIPAPLPVADMLSDYQPHDAVTAGESFDPSQENIDARTRRFQVGDLQVALLPKKTRGETVNVASAFLFGDLTSLHDKALVREMTARLVERGSRDFSRQQIIQEMTRLKMNGDLLVFQTTREHLAEAMAFAGTVLRTASFPASEFEQLQREWLTGLQAHLADPSELARDALQQHFDAYPSGDPRHYLSLQERIDAVKAISLDQVKAFYRDFWGTARGNLAVVGDFDPLAIQAGIPQWYGTWKSPATYAPILHDHHEVTPDTRYLDTPDKENAVYRARLSLQLRDDDPNAPALVLANEILGGGSGLHSRLVERVRQKDGLSYGIGSGLVMNGRDDDAYWGVGAISAPQNLNHVADDVQDELKRAWQDGFTPDEIDEARQGLLQARQMARADDGTLAMAWLVNVDLGRTFAFSRQFEDRLKALTPAQVNDAVRRYLDPTRLSIRLAGDASKGAHKLP
jgi:zinc protease